MWKNRNWRKQINGGKILDEYQSRAAAYVENPTLLNRFLNRVQNIWEIRLLAEYPVLRR